MDTSWIELPNNNPAYKEGVKNFIKLAQENLVEGKTRCPCKRCKVDKWLSLEDVEYHILFQGFDRSYKNWIFHGKGDMFHRMIGSDVGATQPCTSNEQVPIDKDDMAGLLRAAFEVVHEPLLEPLNDFHAEHDSEGIEFDGMHESDTSFNEESNQTRIPIFDEVESAKYQKLVEASNEPLYEGCTTFSKLSFMLHLFQLKCMGHWSAESFTMLLKLLGDAFPQMKDFPICYYDCKKMIKDLGLGYDKIHACPNNCIIYWGENGDKDECPVCHSSRWKTYKGQEGKVSEAARTTKKGEPAKVMRYFPLIPRLKRLYMSSKVAEEMRWHDKDRVDDGMLRHPADGKAWKDFDDKYSDFRDPRSVRLGLASDGFNPYRLMNTTYSTWPVVLICYNLPPWLCMKTSSFILSLIIPGKYGPGNDIDVYLQPLIHELKLLWEGVDAFDAYGQEYFTLRAAVMCTINDFPAYAMLSGWSTKGKKACPVCNNATHSYKFAGKLCYPCARKWLPDDHPYRSQSDKFDGTIEFGRPPTRLTGSEVLQQQKGVTYEYGKFKKRKKTKRKRGRLHADDEDKEGDDEEASGVLWTKQSIFFDLPYWEHNSLRHNLDVMHIEKNVCDILLATILNMDKSRDDVRSREAIKKLGIKPHFWVQSHSGRDQMPRASYSMSPLEKERFLKVLQKLRVPDGYGSNLSRCINMKERKLSNLKSHDNHVLMQDILPVALRASKATKIVGLISDLSSFFKYLCTPVLDPKKLSEAQDKIIETLCQMEMEFLPSFFTIMVHLVTHLIEEVKLGGPVQYRWMYPIERYLAHLKSFVTNKAQPEGSIAEGYALQETMNFCSRFLESVETLFKRPKRNEDEDFDSQSYLYDSGGRVIGKVKDVKLDKKSIKQAHRYVLLHSDEMEVLYDEFLRQKKEELSGEPINEDVQTEWLVNEYPEWLQNQVHNIDATTEEGKLRRALAGGPSNFVRRMSNIVVNGHKFQTMDRERYRKTQNSGVMVEADGQAYYGKLKDIYELDYFGCFKVVLFRCDWADINRGLKSYVNGGVCVSFSKLMHTGRSLHDDPFVFSSQAKQVFYIEDEIQKGWFHVIKTKPRDLFDVGEDVSL